MNKVRIITTGISGVAIAAAMVTPVLAWAPKGTIVKTVQDLTTNSAVASSDGSNGTLTVMPGDTLRYTVIVSNIGEPRDDHHDDMAFTEMTDSLPSGVELISNPSEHQIKEDMGTIVPGANVTKQYEVKVTDQTDGDTISNEACFTGDSTQKDSPQHGCATVVVKVKTPSYACTVLTVTKGDNRTVSISNFQQTAANGAVFKDAVIDWGDNSTPLTTASADKQTHQYAADGTYEITATAHFTVNGHDKTATSTSCAATVSFTTTPPSTPPELPNTGAGDFIIPAVVASITGYVLYLLNARRRAA